MYNGCKMRRNEFKLEMRRQLLIVRASALWNILQLGNTGQTPTTSFMLEPEDCMKEIIHCVCLQ